MLERIIRLSIRQRWAILSLVLLLSALGVYNFSRLKIDAVPDDNKLDMLREENVIPPGEVNALTIRRSAVVFGLVIAAVRSKATSLGDPI